MNFTNLKDKMVKYLSNQVGIGRNEISPLEKFMQENFEWVVDEEGDIGVMLFKEFVIGSYKWSNTFILYHLGDKDVQKFRPIKKRECNLRERDPKDDWTFED